jgi:hypothetical protein
VSKRANFPDFPKPSFDHWCHVVSFYLQLASGRPLADAPVTDAELRIWWAAGVPARVVGQALSVKMPKTRATLSRFYTDRRVQEVRARVLGNLAARGVFQATGA